ncbi:MAG: flagellar biosynthetic protein FliO [Rhodoferax sp.]|nr:flagellar biosynthetic protein FliO [Rhodoferax sp.]
MTPALLAVAAFLVLLALLPAAIKWVQGRLPTAARLHDSATRLVSALAVGPHQRVVTVEVGPADARTMLVLGVTQQSVTCLHSLLLTKPYRPLVEDIPATMTGAS